MKNKLFSNEVVRTGREPELDWARAFAVIFMIMVHILFYLSDYDGSSTMALVIGYLGGPPAAPVFLFLMGVSMLYSRNNTPSQMAKRGVKLLILAYVLNFVRDGLPCLILGAMDIEWGLSAADSFLLLDILHMAGISFLFMALLKKCKASIPVILIITLVMQVAGDLLTHYTDFSQSWLRYLLGYFFYTFDNSAFPIMQWFIYVALGYCFGYFLQRTLDKKRLYTLMFIIGVAYGALVIGIFLLAGVDMVPMFMADADYFHPNLIHHAFYLIAVLIILPVCYLLSSVIKWRPVVFCVNLLSKKVTVVYCIQWILIEWSSFILCIIGMNVIPQEWVLWYSAVVLVLSAALTVVYQIICKRIQLLKNNRSKKTA